MNCQQVRNPDLVEKYVTGQLPEQEMSAFEEHYFGCDDCLAAVQLGQAINLGAGKPAKVIQMPVRNAGGTKRWMYPLAAAAAVVVVTAVGWRFLAKHPSEHIIARQNPSAPVQDPSPAVISKSLKPTQPERQLLASVVDLGAVEPLTYRSSVMRGNSEDSSEKFERAMEWYSKRDYRRTAAGLLSIPVGVPGSGKVEEHINDAGVQLYLGISQLMLNQNDDAIRSFRRAASYGDTPYLESAEFFLTKGLIRQGQYPAAADQLRRVVRLKGDRQAEAQQLLEQLNKLSAR